MTTRDLIKEFVRFADENLVPKLNKLGAAAFYFAVGVMLDAEVLDARLRLVGAVREDGTVDLKRLKAGSDLVFDKTDAIEIGGFKFTRDDAKAFLEELGAA